MVSLNMEEEGLVSSGVAVEAICSGVCQTRGGWRWM